MANQWYRITLFGENHYSPLTAERAEELRAGGMELEPSEAPADLAERLAPIYQALLESGYDARAA